MSFSDFGLEIFPYGAASKSPAPHGDGPIRTTTTTTASNDVTAIQVLSRKQRKALDIETSCYHLVIDHLIDLGSSTESQLAAVKTELERFKRLKLTREQAKQLGLQLIGSCDDATERSVGEPLSEKDIQICNAENNDLLSPPEIRNPLNEIGVYLLNLPGFSLFKRKRSAIASVPSAKQRKKANLAENADDAATFRTTITQKESEIISLKNAKAAKEREVQELEEQKRQLELTVDKMRDDVEILESSSRISQNQIQEIVLQKNGELVLLREDIERLEREVKQLQAVVEDTQAQRNSLTDELKLLRLRSETLSQEREQLGKLNATQESEIEKLLGIVKRLNDSYDRCKTELAAARAQLDSMEREVGQLVYDLAECLGTAILIDPSRRTCAQARELTRLLNRIVREHERCGINVVLREIDRPGESGRAASVGAIEGPKPSLSQEICRLKRVVVGGTNPIEKTERACLQVVADEARLALKKLDRKINDQEVHQRCERFLLLELENLQEALAGVAKVIDGLECSKDEVEDVAGEVDEKASPVSRKILGRLQASTRIAVRITTALRDDSALKATHNKNLERQLEQAMAELEEIGIEKCQLQDSYDECLEQTKQLSAEIERIRAELEERTGELRLMNDEMKAKIESSSSESDALRKQLSISEKKCLASREENSALVKKSDEVIKALECDVRYKSLKLQEYAELNDMLNFKIQESYKLIEQLQVKKLEESMRKVDMENLAALEDRIKELEREKSELTSKTAILESQLSSYERNNGKLQSELAKVTEDNDKLLKVVETLRMENTKLEVSARRQDEEQTSLADKCAELCRKIEKMQECSEGLEMKNESVVQEIEREMRSAKDELGYQQKELLMKEKEIKDKNAEIDDLRTRVKALEDELQSNSLLVLLKKIEALDRERTELKQTASRYEDKLAEMYKKYKLNESELVKSHQESIANLEAKYMEMRKEDEGKVFDAHAWVQTLTDREKQQLHDRICKTPLCEKSTYERDAVYEEHRRRVEKSNDLAKYGSKRPLPTVKKDARINSSTNVSKPSSRQRHHSSARESLSNHSILLAAEKDDNDATTTTPHHRARTAARVK